jgi:kynurenine formamidase
MLRRLRPLVIAAACGACCTWWFAAAAEREAGPALQKWQRGAGWGWVWGAADEVGSLNEMTDASRAAAARLVTRGRVADLGVTYDRTSFKWPGHSPGEIMAFRTPEGVKRQQDLPFARTRTGTAWHSGALIISDNIGTQIDSLAHATEGDDDHWYNGFTEAEWGGNWGPRRCDASTIPPVVARGVLIDVAGAQDVDALPGNTPIGISDLRAALDRQGTKLHPGDVVLIRTGAMRYWGETGADHERLAAHDSAGITLESAKWLVEEQGAMLLGSDTSGLEYNPPAAQAAAYHEQTGSFMPVHNYLLIQQGVHIGEFHNLEELSRERVYEFCYIATTNKIKGSTAGFALRPIALY